MAKLALAAMALWAATMFGLRDYIQRRRTGASGFVPPDPGLGWRARGPGLMLLLALLLAPAACVLELRGVLRPLWDTDARGARLAAWTLFLVGWLGTFLCQLAMGDSWRIGIDAARRTELVTGGIYGVVRNPIYALVIVSVGALVAAVPNAASLAAFALVALGLDLWVRLVEEPFLLERHGDAYALYAARVGRFVPGVGRLRTRPRP